jgi:hypothetical protein
VPPLVLPVVMTMSVGTALAASLAIPVVLSAGVPSRVLR